MVTVGGIDTYYDYDEQCWKYRRLGGGPVHDKPTCPIPAETEAHDAHRPAKHRLESTGR
jgi:hypothetical protein